MKNEEFVPNRFVRFAKLASTKTWAGFAKAWQYWIVIWPYVRDLLIFVWKWVLIPASLASLTILRAIALPLSASIISAAAIITSALVTTIAGQAVLAASTAWVAVNYLGFSIKDINSTEGFWAILEGLMG
ncbi:MAG: hypothetical protein L7U45_04485 [Alphaproteobacteria bacterium]|nr:hypothetical protein [Alphaproteobacteria bacterium]